MAQGLCTVLSHAPFATFPGMGIFTQCHSYLSLNWTTSQLDNCHVVYMDFPSKSIQKLQLVQNTHYTYCTLKAALVGLWVQFKVLTLTFKVLQYLDVVLMTSVYLIR